MAERPGLFAEDWNRLNRLLERGLALEAEERASWLATLPRESDHLREVLAQLLAKSTATGFSTDTSVPTALARVAAEAVAAMRHDRVGDRIGPWRLERLLAEGGMGTVWLAQRADGVMHRQAALKLPRAEWIDRGLSERIARERAILARLQHPFIAVLYDAGLANEGRPYLALEYVDGAPIHTHCKSLDLTATLQLFVQVVRAVAYAHSRLVIHRDLKPNNVLVTADGTPKLLDFGISKLIEGDGPVADETALTRLGGRPLTLSYAAPEQILGQPVTVAADVYALGVMLFELTSGARLYQAATPQLLEAEILHGDLRRPSDVAPDRTRASSLRGDLDAIVLNALKRAPEARYGSAEALADDIERYLTGKPVKAQPDSRGYRLRKFVQRNALAVAAGSAIVAALAIGLGAALWQANVAGDQARRATLIKDFVLAIIQQADPVASGQTRAADVALLTTAEARVDRELEREPELALQMRRAIGAAYRNRGEFDRASRVLRKGIEQARASLPPDNLELLGAMVQIADRWVVDSAQVKTDIETAVTRLRGLGPDAQLLLADALLARHKVMNWHVSWRDAVASEREAYGAARATGDQGRALDVAIESATWHLTNEIEPRMALTMLTEALEAPTQGRPVDATDPRRIIAMAWQGAALCHAGQETEGLRRTEEALEAARKFHGADSNAAEQVHGALGTLLELCTRDLKRALAPTRAAYDLAVKRESPDAENRTWRQISLMRLLIMLNLLSEADEVARENPLDVLRPGSRTAPAVVGLIWESHVRGFLGETEKALELAEQAARLMEQQNMVALAEQVYGALSRALQRSGNYERAEEAALAAIKHEDLGQPATPKRRAINLDRLCRIRLARGNYQGALATAEQLQALLSENGISVPEHRFNADFQRGRALAGLGRYDEAVVSLAKVYAMSPGPLVALHYGRALVATGEVERGRALIAAATPKLAASRDPQVRSMVRDGPQVAKSE